MKNGLTLLFGGLALVFSLQVAAAADVEPAKVTAKRAAVVKKSMAEKGSFHKVHGASQKLECDDCHDKSGLPDDTLQLRLHEDLPKDSPGAVSSKDCHECHGKPTKLKNGKSVNWYAPK